VVVLVSMKLLECFCESRKTQAFYSKCIDEAQTEEEKDFLRELVKMAAKTSNEIKQFCEDIKK
jgi:major intracellular serine protease